MLTHSAPIKLTVGISIVLLIFIGQCRPGQTDNAELCKNVKCSSPPKGFNCSDTNITSSKIEKRLGALKDCCPVYYCKNGTKDEFLFIGVNEKKKEDAKAAASQQGDSQSSDVCDNVSCSPDLPGSVCTVETNVSSAIMEFAKGTTACCPVKSCRSTDGFTRIRFSIIHGKLPPLNQLNELANRCDEFSCPTKPNIKDATCLVQPADKGIPIAESLGKLNNCCPIWQCTYLDGVVYYHFSIQGSSFKYREILRKAQKIDIPVKMFSNDAGNSGVKSSSTVSSKTTSTSSQNVDLNGKNAGSEQNNAATGNKGNFQCPAEETCPKLKKEGCSYSFSEDYDKFVPSEDKCCPLMHCTDESGKQRTHYVKYSGNIPTEEREIEKEKGKSIKGNKCPKISCAETPKMSKLKDCTSQPIGLTMIPKIKPFSSCCSAWRCSRDDGSYSLELGLIGLSFSYVEISFHDIVVEDLESSSMSMQKSSITVGKTKSSASKKMNSQSYAESKAGENHWMTMGQWVPQSLTGLQNFAFQQANQNSLINPLMSQQVPFAQPIFGR